MSCLRCSQARVFIPLCVQTRHVLQPVWFLSPGRTLPPCTRIDTDMRALEVRKRFHMDFFRLQLSLCSSVYDCEENSNPEGARHMLTAPKQGGTLMGDEWQQNPGYGPQNAPKNPESGNPPEEPEDVEIPQEEQAPLNPQEIPQAEGYQGTQAAPGAQPSGQENIDKRIEDIKRIVIQGAGEATRRFSRVAERATEYWQQASAVPTPRRSSSMEEERIRQFANMWSSGNWQIARELGNYMDITSIHEDEAWEIGLQTRWETRSIEMVADAYTGRQAGPMRPVLPIWDYDLPPVTGLKAPETRMRLEGNDEVLACTACNSTGHLLCANCSGR